MTISIQVSPGELIDKMTILDVKLARMSDPAKLVNVRREHAMIVQTFHEKVIDSPALAQLIAQLKAANSALWTIEDDIRDHERKGDFDRATNALKAAVFWNPKLVPAHVLLGRIAVLKSDCATAQGSVGKALEIAFEKDKTFGEWLKSQTAETFKLTAPKAAEAGPKGR